MKKLLFSFIFIIIGYCVVDRLGGMTMWWVNQHTNDKWGPKIKYLVNEVREDVVLIGTSRCNFHYVPSIISDTLNMSVYNGGIDASDNIFSHYIILNHILSHYIPKIICLEVMENDYTQQKDPYTSIAFFAPYLGLNSKADSVFMESGSYYLYCFSHLYRYNSKAVSNITGLTYKKTQTDNGYFPAPSPLVFPQKLEEETASSEIDNKKIAYIQRFINLCRENSLKLIFVVSPRYTIVNSNHYDTIKKIAQENDIPFMDYHTTGLFLNHPEYFQDKAHLWDKGARLYSMIFARDLKRILMSIN